MQGLEIARNYYREFGESAIQENFPELEDTIAVGLAGSGSECYGFDDEISKDHDFEPGFCLWIPEEDEVDSRTAFRLERMYAKLPKEYMGLRRSIMAPAGGNRHGVIRISEFLERHIGKTDTDFSVGDWFSIPEYAFAEVVNGQVWRDRLGKFTDVRREIRRMPDDILFKKLAGSLYIMGQSGSYNYSRCIAHGEKGAAQLSLTEFVKHAMHAAFLLNFSYMPYYKWSFRAMRKLDVLAEMAEDLEYLLNTGNEPEMVEKKMTVIEKSGCAVINVLQERGLGDGSGMDLGKNAECVNNRINDNFVRNTDLLAGVSILL